MVKNLLLLNLKTNKFERGPIHDGCIVPRIFRSQGHAIHLSYDENHKIVRRIVPEELLSQP